MCLSYEAILAATVRRADSHRRADASTELSDAVYKAFISSLKASPSYAPAFTSLGLYYRSLSEPDWERSSKCFQKAFELDPGQEVAAKHLAEEFAELSEWGLVEVIARRVVEGNKGKAGMGGKAAARLAWAWKAIGGAELVSCLDCLPQLGALGSLPFFFPGLAELEKVPAGDRRFPGCLERCS